MPESSESPSTLLPGANLTAGYEQLAERWRGWRPGAPEPHWKAFLPERACTPDSVLLLLKSDIDFRVRSRLPALLLDGYFRNEQLPGSARLSAEQQRELIRWEYQRRWRHGQRIGRQTFLDRFPEHADDLRDLSPSWNCPNCGQQNLTHDESATEVACPSCRIAVPLSVLSGLRLAEPTVGAELIPPRGEAGDTCGAGLDLRDYELLEPLGRGGMGEVYRSRDPGLGRDLALKVLRDSFQGRREVEHRFEQEARITGSLQHPGVVPVHNLGRLPDGRLYFTMKVVRGRTFAEILAQQADNSPGRRADHVAIFEKVCQTIAYAHSKGVIHRDLKPGNVMVGAFGEVQVMDWGLAKILSRREKEDGPTPETSANSVLPVTPTDDPELQSRHGAVLGTYAYMSPEQAAGAIELLDERTDVFALGAILCQILTGKPPYTGPTPPVLHDQALRADLVPAMDRLNRCGAEDDLVALAKRCLAVEPADRPSDGGAVARAVADHFAGVQERLRQAERQRAAAEVRVVEETRRRRLAVALLACLLLLLLGGGAAAWRWQRQLDRQAEAASATQEVIERARRLLDQGWLSQDLAVLRQARADAEHAADIARTGQASADVLDQAETLRQRVQERLDATRRNEELRGALVDVAVPPEFTSYHGEAGRMTALALPPAGEQYAAAFQRWGLDVDGTPEARVVERLLEEPPVVVRDIVSALDAWMRWRLERHRPEAEWGRLFRVADQVDQNARRRQLRALLIDGYQPSPESVVGLLAAPPAWPALGRLAYREALRRRRLRELLRQVEPASEPVLTVLLLSQTSSATGEKAAAETLLRQALAARPGEVVLLQALARLLERQGPARRQEAIGCYRAIRVARPRLGVALSLALVESDQAAEAESVLRELLAPQRNNPDLHFHLALALAKQKKWPQAEATYREAIRLKPDYPEARHNLGAVLADQKKWPEALAAYREAIRRLPNQSETWANLGFVLQQQKKLPEAATAYQKAIRLAPDSPRAHLGLGNLRLAQKRLPEAEAAYQEAIRLDPSYAMAYSNLGVALKDQNKLPQAAAALQEAIRLKPDDATAHFNLGLVLAEQLRWPEAEAAYREAIRLDPDHAKAHSSLGTALGQQHKLPEAVAAYKTSIRLKADEPRTHVNLGLVLLMQKKWPEAESAYKEAVRLRPGDVGSHFNLAHILSEQKKLPEAVAALEEAIRVKPDYRPALYRLGVVLSDLEDWPGSAAAFRKFLRLEPDSPLAHLGLALALRQQGKFAESLAAYRRCHELGVKKPGWTFPSAERVRDAERLIELEKKLPALLQGKARPKDAGEQVELALLCKLKRWYAASAHFFAGAIRDSPKPVDEGTESIRFAAACCAALAGRGKGEDQPRPDEEQRARLRQQALGWLRAELAACAKRLAAERPQDRAAAAAKLASWSRDKDLAVVRDKSELDKLPEEERAAWRKLWADVAALKNKATAASPR